MKVYLEVEVPGLEETDRLREDLRLEVEVQLGTWAHRYGVHVELAEDPNEQYNRGYDDGRDAMYIDMANEQGAQAE